jgi:glycine cleavage system H protein
MANIQENLHYSKDHEWVSVDGDVATIGITDYAQHSFGSVESVKAVSEIFTPIVGEVVEVNEGLNDTPETVNSDPYGAAWMIKIKMKNHGEADAMLSAAEYEEYLSANG